MKYIFSPIIFVISTPEILAEELIVKIPAEGLGKIVIPKLFSNEFAEVRIVLKAFDLDELRLIVIGEGFFIVAVQLMLHRVFTRQVAVV